VTGSPTPELLHVRLWEISVLRLITVSLAALLALGGAACGSAAATTSAATPAPTLTPAVAAYADYCRDLNSLTTALTHASNGTGGTDQLSGAGWALALDSQRFQAAGLAGAATATARVSGDAISAATTANAEQDATGQITTLTADIKQLPACGGVTPAAATPTPAPNTPAADLTSVEAAYMPYAADRALALTTCTGAPYSASCSGQWSAVAADVTTMLGSLPKGQASDAAALSSLRAAMTSLQSSSTALSSDYSSYNRSGVLSARGTETSAFAAYQSALKQLEQVAAAG
jgi:hypothetical protein